MYWRFLKLTENGKTDLILNIKKEVPRL